LRFYGSLLYRDKESLINGYCSFRATPTGLKQSKGINLSALIGVFENQNLRSAADILGTWELYAFGHLHR
jgi:hypothetical protein